MYVYKYLCVCVRARAKKICQMTKSVFVFYLECVKVTLCVVLFCRVVVLESRPTDNPTALSNLYILAGHENSY